MAPVDPRDPYIPDGLEGPFPTIPTRPPTGAGGEPEMAQPSLKLGPGWN
ncbi:hypothetical protein ABGB07_41305 [Micromonosporaceae bacterium B7E4]